MIKKETSMNTIPRSPFRRIARLSALAGGLLALGAASAHAQTYNVSLDTTGLIAGDNYAIDFQLNQGGATPTSAVTVGNFLFGGGSAGLAATIQTSGLASGSLSSSVALGSSAASPFNEFTQNFNTGSSVGFTVSAGQLMAQAGAAPDGFFFDLIDNSVGPNGMLVTTNDGSGQNSLFTLTRGAGGAYTVQNFGYTSAQGTTITTASAPPAVPEASTTVSLGLLLALGLGGTVVAARRRKRAR